jgi:hypothetical protein
MLDGDPTIATPTQKVTDGSGVLMMSVSSIAAVAGFMSIARQGVVLQAAASLPPDRVATLHVTAAITDTKSSPKKNGRIKTPCTTAKWRGDPIFAREAAAVNNEGIAFAGRQV